MDPVVAQSIEWAVAFGFTLFGVLCVAIVMVGLPGAWILIAAAMTIDLLDWLWLAPGSPLTFHPVTIVAAGLVAGIGELLEFMLSAFGAKRFGASRSGMVGSIIGGFVGAILGTVLLVPLPVVGTLAGALLGTAAGAVVGEMRGGRKLGETARPALGAVLGRLLGTMAKLPCAIVVLAILIVAAFVR
jgi:uncharacterized protein